MNVVMIHTNHFVNNVYEIIYETKGWVYMFIHYSLRITLSDVLREIFCFILSDVFKFPCKK